MLQSAASSHLCFFPLSFFLFSLSPSPLLPSQKLSVHSHFLWLLSLSPDLMRTIWGKEAGRVGGGEASIFPLPLGYVHGSWHTLPQTPLTNWILVTGVRGAEGRAQSRAGAPEGDLC